MFIVFEGTDGSGTSTQAKLLKEYFETQGKSVFSTAQPSNSIIGKKIRKILQEHTTIDPFAFQLLFFADRQEHLKNEIIPALESGKIVICERYIWSSIAYGEAQGVNTQSLQTIAKEMIIPNITFFCSLNAQASIERIEKRGMKKEKFEKTEILTQVKANMEKLYINKRFTKQAIKVDSTQPPEIIAKQVIQTVEKLPF